MDGNGNAAGTTSTALSPAKRHSVNLDPIAVDFDAAEAISSLSRRTLYELIGRGELDARKSGAKTLVLFSSLKRYLESLPKAAIKAPKEG